MARAISAWPQRWSRSRLTYPNEKSEVEGVRYKLLSMAFINAFKEQQEQIERQQEQIERQKEQIEELQSAVAKLTEAKLAALGSPAAVALSSAQQLR
jgi:uncharacterized protein HemX